MAKRNRAYISAVRSELENLIVAEEVYFFNHGRYANRLEDLDFVPSRSGLTIEIVSADENCFEAKGTYAGLKEPIWIDCNGAK